MLRQAQSRDLISQQKKYDNREGTHFRSLRIPHSLAARSRLILEVPTLVVIFSRFAFDLFGLRPPGAEQFGRDVDAAW